MRRKRRLILLWLFAPLIYLLIILEIGGFLDPKEPKKKARANLDKKQIQKKRE